jgi:hypothetical protein
LFSLLSTQPGVSEAITTQARQELDARLDALRLYLQLTPENPISTQEKIPLQVPSSSEVADLDDDDNIINLPFIAETDLQDNSMYDAAPEWSSDNILPHESLQRPEKSLQNDLFSSFYDYPELSDPVRERFIQAWRRRSLS